jgi:hypothetical protein
MTKNKQPTGRQKTATEQRQALLAFVDDSDPDLLFEAMQTPFIDNEWQSVLLAAALASMPQDVGIRIKRKGSTPLEIHREVDKGVIVLETTDADGKEDQRAAAMLALMHYLGVVRGDMADNVKVKGKILNAVVSAVGKFLELNGCEAEEAAEAANEAADSQAAEVSEQAVPLATVPGRQMGRMIDEWLAAYLADGDPNQRLTDHGLAWLREMLGQFAAASFEIGNILHNATFDFETEFNNGLAFEGESVAELRRKTEELIDLSGELIPKKADRLEITDSMEPAHRLIAKLRKEGAAIRLIAFSGRMAFMAECAKAMGKELLLRQQAETAGNGNKKQA